MEKFEILNSTVVPLKMEDIDTDQIIPARFLKRTTREGFGENLFSDWRFDENNIEKTNFILNDSRFKGKILLTGKNFGCGSSREHAAWALYDYGFRVVISSFFADIFKNNALNNGLLPIEISQPKLDLIFSEVNKNPSLKITVDLANQKLEIIEKNLIEKFEINSHKKECLLEGYDDIDYLISRRDKIKEYEKTSKYLELIK